MSKEWPDIMKLREQHQRLAKDLSQGRAVPSVSRARANQLRKSPAFVELMATKRAGARVVE